MLPVGIVFWLSVNLALIEGNHAAQSACTDDKCEDDSRDALIQGYSDFYDCIIKCYKDAFEINVIKGDMCKQTIEFRCNTSDPRPMEQVAKSIECITVNCGSAVPPLVCSTGSASDEKDSTKDIAKAKFGGLTTASATTLTPTIATAAAKEIDNKTTEGSTTASARKPNDNVQNYEHNYDKYNKRYYSDDDDDDDDNGSVASSANVTTKTTTTTMDKTITTEVTVLSTTEQIDKNNYSNDNEESLENSNYFGDKDSTDSTTNIITTTTLTPNDFDDMYDNNNTEYESNYDFNSKNDDDSNFNFDHDNDKKETAETTDTITNAITGTWNLITTNDNVDCYANRDGFPAEKENLGYNIDDSNYKNDYGNNNYNDYGGNVNNHYNYHNNHIYYYNDNNNYQTTNNQNTPIKSKYISPKVTREKNSPLRKKIKQYNNYLNYQPETNVEPFSTIYNKMKDYASSYSFAESSNVRRPNNNNLLKTRIMREEVPVHDYFDLITAANQKNQNGNIKDSHPVVTEQNYQFEESPLNLLRNADAQSLSVGPYQQNYLQNLLGRIEQLQASFKHSLENIENKRIRTNQLAT